MAKRPRKPLEDMPHKIRSAMETTNPPRGSNGAAKAQRDDLSGYLSDDRTLTEPEPAPTASAPDPAVQRGPTPTLNFHAEAWERIREAGSCLRAFLREQPLAIELLSDFEEDVVKQTVGRGTLEIAAKEAGKLQQAERERTSAEKKRIPYPSVSGQAFDLLDQVPGYPDPGGY